MIALQMVLRFDRCGSFVAVAVDLRKLTANPTATVTAIATATAIAMKTLTFRILG